MIVMMSMFSIPIRNVEFLEGSLNSELMFRKLPCFIAKLVFWRHRGALLSFIKKKFEGLGSFLRFVAKGINVNHPVIPVGGIGIWRK
jgi:hypothetical protein